MLIPDPAPGPRTDELLTRAEVARLLRVSPRTVTRWTKTGKLRSLRTLGGHHRYYASEIRTRRPSSPKGTPGEKAAVGQGPPSGEDRPREGGNGPRPEASAIPQRHQPPQRKAPP